MSRIDDSWAAEQRRRWMRPNAHLWIRPDAYRFMAPGAPRWVGKDVVRYFWPDAASDQQAPAGDRKSHIEPPPVLASNAARADVDRELASLRWHAAAMRVELALLKLAHFYRKANFNPNQPRVPAGNPDGGQWTSEGGASRNDPRVISDATPDNVWILGAQYAHNETQSRYSVDLQEEERRGGHTIDNHVGKTDEELLAIVRGDRGQAGIYRYARRRHGSFDSGESANDFVNRTLEQNQDLVDVVASGLSGRQFLNARFGYKTGREAFRPSIHSEPYLRNTYEVGVEIRHDPSAPRGYRVHTAYPRNSDPQ